MMTLIEKYGEWELGNTELKWLVFIMKDYEVELEYDEIIEILYNLILKNDWKVNKRTWAVQKQMNIIKLWRSVQLEHDIGKASWLKTRKKKWDVRVQK